MKRFILCLVLCISAAAAQDNQQSAPLVLTSVAPIYQITSALLVNTTIEVENIPARPRSLSAQTTFFARQGERFTEQFEKADAVITIGKIWPQDSFYTTAREANIRIVNIDASKPWSHELAGVTMATSPVDGDISPFFWTSPANAIRSLNIVARDLQTLYPSQADIIATNLENQQNALITLKANFESAFVEVFDPFIYALADEFTYLTSELGIFVDDYFIKQDIDWTEQDLQNLTRHLLDADIKVVIHKWQPSDPINTAIEAAGTKLVVLDLMESSSEDYFAILQSNLDLLLNAFLAVEQN